MYNKFQAQQEKVKPIPCYLVTNKKKYAIHALIRVDELHLSSWIAGKNQRKKSAGNPCLDYRKNPDW